MLTTEQQRQIHHNIQCLKDLGEMLVKAKVNCSVHSKDWDQGFTEAMNLIGEWILSIAKQT